MSYRNYYRVVISNDFLGVSKEISAPNRYELERKVENQKRIWQEKMEREIVKHSKEQTKRQAERLTENDQEIMSQYESIIKNICKKSSNEYYDSLLKNDKYKSFTTNLIEPDLEKIYVELQVPYPSFWEKIFKSKLEKRLTQEENAKELYKIRKDYYDKELENQKKIYENEKNKFIEEQNNHNKTISQNKNKYQNGDILEIEKYFSFVLDSSIYPAEFIKDFELQYIKENKILVVSYYLPNEDLVPRTIQHKYIATKNKIEEIKLNDKKFEKFYNDVIYMCSLRTIKELFSSADLNYIDTVVYNGWLKYIDKSTGNNAESCILTVEVNKSRFEEINLDNVNYKSCIKGLKGIFAPSALMLTPVVPFLNINRNDKRFIESKEVNNITMDGFNLATMPWEDFEYFVRELFDKMFNANGGEVKVTRASHDGGVDAIAFDDDPIRGGKFVIQAKRYNNVVPVSAVRDLYGTMIHEGATKGILVTTSFYGKESYDFAKDKPITLIDGQALLGLLNKYGYSNLTIKIDKHQEN